jgi:hypothetical protein
MSIRFGSCALPGAVGPMLLSGAILACLPVPADASLVVSNDPTANVSCSAGVCTATAESAVLNVRDLTGMLGSSSVKLVSGTIAKDIRIATVVYWTSSNGLTLDAYRSITVRRVINVAGPAPVTLLTNDGGSGGTLAAPLHSSIVTFLGLTNTLTINGQAYTLVGSISQLAGDVAANPSGYYALAHGYDATQDGTYAAAPIHAEFMGTFEGLGNPISNLKIRSTSRGDGVGLFAYVNGGSLRDVRLLHASIAGTGGKSTVGALVGLINGTVTQSYATGTVKGVAGYTGGLVGELEGGSIVQSHAAVIVLGKAANSNVSLLGGLVGVMVGAITAISQSYATGTVTGITSGSAGGLLGFCASNGVIDQSYATGAVTLTASKTNSYRNGAGGLAGTSECHVSNSYASGGITGSGGDVNSFPMDIGGLVGDSQIGWTVRGSYSTGVVKAEIGSIGGLIGWDSGHTSKSYWDTDSSLITDLSQGAGNRTNDPGITGLTTVQFQSGLPLGFNPGIWGQGANINNGLPYLLALPPR